MDLEVKEDGEDNAILAQYLQYSTWIFTWSSLQTPAVTHSCYLQVRVVADCDFRKHAVGETVDGERGRVHSDTVIVCVRC